MHNNEYLVPISNRIKSAIIEFCEHHLVFHADDLRRYVCNKCGHVAPASADRVLRDLRSKGLVDYKVDRAASLYTVLDVRAA